MDYLVIEGYKDAAESFANEAGISPQVDLQSIGNRMTVRSAIQRGDIEEAIGRANELDPEVRIRFCSLFPMLVANDRPRRKTEDGCDDDHHGMIIFMHHAEVAGDGFTPPGELLIPCTCG